LRSDSPPPVELVHDGSPTGCLCAVAEAYKRPGSPPVRFARPDAVRDLFAAARETVESDPARAERFLNYIAERSSRDVVHTLLRALTAMPEGLEPALLGYARKAVMHGACIAKALADPDVIFIHRWARRVSLEIHRFKGLLRFQELQSGRFIALYEPDYDITLPLAFHFRHRLASQRWIILDCRRRRAATWNGTRLNAETPAGDLLEGDVLDRCLAGDEPSSGETRSRALWKTFHRTVAIETRLNPALQRQFMPSRYWKHLTEMEG
jgi:probable DNA metabolism protein